MVKKIITICFEVLFIGLCLFLVLQSTSLFIYTTNRAKTIIDINNVKTFFEIIPSGTENKYFQEIVDNIQKFFINITNINLDQIEAFTNLILDIIYEIIVYFCNIWLSVFLVISITLHEIFSKVEPEVKTSKGAKLYLWYLKQKAKLLKFIKTKILKIWKLIKKNKRPILFHIFLIFVSNGLVYLILTELFIFFEVYIIRLINLEMYQLVFAIFRYLFVKLYPIITHFPKSVLILSLICFIFVSALSRAKYKLKKNHERLKKFVKEDITQTTFINGPPGSGKTLLNSSLTLIVEENYIDELEENMMKYQIQYPSYNFSRVRNKLTQEHKEYYLNYDYWINRKTYITSNYSIYSPYFMSYSKIFDFNWMRKNKKVAKYPLEEYIVISISELDKEYNSHDDMKAVGEDGAATFFSTVSHDLKRHVKIFCDYQLKDQVPLRIRGNSEYFYTIESRKKKYPILLYLYYHPFIKLHQLLEKFILKYETKKKRINKQTERIAPSIFKRNDYTLIYALIRHHLKTVDNICKWFDHFWYFKITGDLSYKDGEKGKKKVLNINLCDLKINKQKLYDSTFLSYAYESKKNYKFKDLETFTSLTPTIEELTKCNSRFYNKINNISSTKQKEEDEYIDL